MVAGQGQHRIIVGFARCVKSDLGCAARQQRRGQRHVGARFAQHPVRGRHARAVRINHIVAHQTSALRHHHKLHHAVLRRVAVLIADQNLDRIDHRFAHLAAQILDAGIGHAMRNIGFAIEHKGYADRLQPSGRDHHFVQSGTGSRGVGDGGDTVGAGTNDRRFNAAGQSADREHRGIVHHGKINRYIGDLVAIVVLSGNRQQLRQGAIDRPFLLIAGDVHQPAGSPVDGGCRKG